MTWNFYRWLREAEDAGRFDPELAKAARIAVPALVIWVAYELWSLVCR